MGQDFNLTPSTRIECKSKSTRTGFYHRAELVVNNEVVAFARVSYINRTWERFTYQTVIKRLLRKVDGVVKDEISKAMYDLVKD